MKRETKPKWDGGQDYRAGLKAYELAQEFKDVLEPRLGPGTLDGLKEDLDALAQAGDQTAAKITELKGYTGSQDEMLRRTAAWTGAVREALKRGKAPKDVLKAAGVGGTFREGRVDSALASLNALIAAYGRFPDEFRACGVLPDDLEAGKKILISLNAADLDQESFKASKPATTAQHNALRKRIEAAVDRIRGAGILHFHDTPTTAARFAALVPAKRKGAAGAVVQPLPKEPQKGT
jgi:hypothetical protein